jgi:hypothetical protein
MLMRVTCTPTGASKLHVMSWYWNVMPVCQLLYVYYVESKFDWPLLYLYVFIVCSCLVVLLNWTRDVMSIILA